MTNVRTPSFDTSVVSEVTLRTFGFWPVRSYPARNSPPREIYTSNDNVPTHTAKKCREEILLP